ncbi:hypothetical protein ACAG39_01895 [Caldicellulosiruptoraceae bacterium PP1]
MKAKLIVIITFIVITIAYTFAIVKIYNDGKTENCEKYSISMYNAITNTKELEVKKGIINVNNNSYYFYKDKNYLYVFDDKFTNRYKIKITGYKNEMTYSLISKQIEKWIQRAKPFNNNSITQDITSQASKEAIIIPIVLFFLYFVFIFIAISMFDTELAKEVYEK